LGGSALGYASETTPPPPLPGPAVINIIPLPRPPPGRSRAPSSLRVCGEQGWPLLLLFPPLLLLQSRVASRLQAFFSPSSSGDLLRGGGIVYLQQLKVITDQTQGSVCVRVCVCVRERESDPTKMSWNESVNASPCRA